MNHVLLKNKNILIAVSGSIAAYKIPNLIRMLTKAGAFVKVVQTENSKEFVTPLALEITSGNSVHDNIFSDPLAHIDLGKWADILVICPASASIIGRMANGICNDLITNIYCAFSRGKPVVVFPAMNSRMLTHPSLLRNIAILESDGTIVESSERGELACGEVDYGRLASFDAICAKISRALEKFPLRGKNILISGGGTSEALDPVRNISNNSSGYFALCLSYAFFTKGANVKLIMANHSVDVPDFLNVEYAYSADAMHSAILDNIETNTPDVFIGAAAVADYKPKYVNEKIQKDGNNSINLELFKNIDIISCVSELKINRPKLVVGFAAQTSDVVKNATCKLKAKKLDAIVANEVGSNKGFGEYPTSVYFITSSNMVEFSEDGKEVLSYKIVEEISKMFDS